MLARECKMVPCRMARKELMALSSEWAVRLDTCAACHRCPELVESARLLMCACGDALYCDVECEAKDWKTHKLTCTARTVGPK